MRKKTKRHSPVPHRLELVHASLKEISAKDVLTVDDILYTSQQLGISLEYLKREGPFFRDVAEQVEEVMQIIVKDVIANPDPELCSRAFLTMCENISLAFNVCTEYRG